MKVNIIANHIRTQRNEILTVEMLKAELEEVKSLKPADNNAKIAKRRHMLTLMAAIKYKENHPS